MDAIRREHFGVLLADLEHLFERGRSSRVVYQPLNILAARYDLSQLRTTVVLQVAVTF